MSQVKMKDIPFDERYVKLALDDNVLVGPMVANLKSLYRFIDNNSQGNSIYEFGKAYKAILKKAQTIAGNRKYIISKRQVRALISSEIVDDINYIKIPYASDYIFRAIFQIFEEYRNNPAASVPSEIQNLYQMVRRDAFYLIQSQQYEYKYAHNLLNRREDLERIRRALLNDLCSETCALGKQV